MHHGHGVPQELFVLVLHFKYVMSRLLSRSHTHIITISILEEGLKAIQSCYSPRLLACTI